ncbi:MAG: Hsp20/alpha crystallin family protein [Deltaproteobacteria bacterium]|nr:Hsp20/alpha crystallin family protein [Deltaproteobacteria bacterium]
MTTAAIEKKEHKNESLQQAEQTPRIQVQRVMPAVDIFENDNELVFVADMPGVAKDGLDVQVEKMELTLSGAVTEAYRYERSFKLPATVDVEKVSASLKNGVLNVTFKKAESAKPKKIKVELQK